MYSAFNIKCLETYIFTEIYPPSVWRNTKLAKTVLIRVNPCLTSLCQSVSKQ